MLKMVIRDWLKLAKKQIDVLDAELIALAVVAPWGADRSWLVTHDVVEITTEQRWKLEEMVKRRAKSEPLAYILGWKEFYGRNFRVNSKVLIPRPETEDLVDLTLEFMEKSKNGVFEALEGDFGALQAKAEYGQGLAKKRLKTSKKWQILEIGTGSGCIATTLSLEMAARGISGVVTATDVSGAALGMARRNAVNLGAEVRFLQSDLLEKIRMGEEFDIVVANLPYVDRNWEWLDSAGLSYEPDLALYAGDGGLALYKKMLRQIKEKGIGVSVIVVEVDPCQQSEIREVAMPYDFVLRKTRGYGMVFVKRK